MKVVHCKKEPYTVYIGRPSIFGNPFSIGKDGTREDVIEKYTNWIENLASSQESMLLEAIYNLKEGDILGCWCKPNACHGDVIIEIWKNLHRNDNIKEIK